ncbi:unnamed protein product [Mycena citricolor]|uniref:Uncharacterized protein n=1 Tax=Mycena citricolor TaxID=2018698 RepID=A0AAD2HPP2_9AGAR|nr:unnamed protein product [Mycena citricolor]
MSRHPGRARHVRKEGLRGETTHRKPHRGRYHQYRVLHFSQYAVLHKTYESRALAFDADEICFDSEQGNCVSNVVRGEAVASKGNRYPAVVEEAGIVNLTLHTQLTNTLTENLARNIIDRTHGAFARIDSAPGGNETAKGALRTAHQLQRPSWMGSWLPEPALESSSLRKGTWLSEKSTGHTSSSSTRSFTEWAREDTLQAPNLTIGATGSAFHTPSIPACHAISAAIQRVIIGKKLAEDCTMPADLLDRYQRADWGPTKHWRRTTWPHFMVLASSGLLGSKLD